MLPPALAKQVRRFEEIRRRSPRPGDPQDRGKGVFNMAAVWGPEVSELNVCFTEGGMALRRAIARVAREWTAAIPSLPRLNFGGGRNPQTCDLGRQLYEIRISLNEAEDTWSLSGSQSILDQSRPSMNFSGIATRPERDAWFRTSVLHEFGHAFGLEHEHQHPDGTCERHFNWPKVLEITGQPPNNWTEEQTRFQLGRLDRENNISTLPFNPDSVMIYEFEPAFFIDGTSSPCYQQRKTRISRGDIAMLLEAYPAQREDRIAMVNQVIAHQRAIIRGSDRLQGGEKKAVEDLFEQMIGYAPRKR
jgi:hypothetical protein